MADIEDHDSVSLSEATLVQLADQLGRRFPSVVILCAGEDENDDDRHIFDKRIRGLLGAAYASADQFMRQVRKDWANADHIDPEGN